MPLFNSVPIVVAEAANNVSTVTDALKTAMSNAGSDLLGVLAAVVPVALPVMIGVAAIGIGIKVFKKVTK